MLNDQDVGERAHMVPSHLRPELLLILLILCQDVLCSKRRVNSWEYGPPLKKVKFEAKDTNDLTVPVVHQESLQTRMTHFIAWKSMDPDSSDFPVRTREVINLYFPPFVRERVLFLPRIYAHLETLQPGLGWLYVFPSFPWSPFGLSPELLRPNNEAYLQALSQQDLGDTQKAILFLQTLILATGSEWDGTIPNEQIFLEYLDDCITAAWKENHDVQKRLIAFSLGYFIKSPFVERLIRKQVSYMELFFASIFWGAQVRDDSFKLAYKDIFGNQ